MKGPECPDHPDLTMHGLIGDYYCLAPECGWWDAPLDDDSRRA